MKPIYNKKKENRLKSMIFTVLHNMFNVQFIYDFVQLFVYFSCFFCLSGTTSQPHLTQTPHQHCRHPPTLTLSQHTHMQHKQQYMHHSHRNNRTHNIGYYDNLTNRPRTTTGLLTPHKHTCPAVKVREISSYCKST